jgi:hypothetical protein
MIMHKSGAAYSEVTQKKSHGQQRWQHQPKASPSSPLCLEAPNPNHLLLAKATLQTSMSTEWHIQGYATHGSMISNGLIHGTSFHRFSIIVTQGQPAVVITFLCKAAWLWLPREEQQTVSQTTKSARLWMTIDKGRKYSHNFAFI